MLLYNRIAVLYRDKMGKADRALRAFEAVLKLDARNLTWPLRRSSRFMRGEGSQEAGLWLGIQLSHTEDLATRVERMQKLAELTETSLKDKGTAYSWYLKGFWRGSSRRLAAPPRSSAWLRKPVVGLSLWLRTKRQCPSSRTRWSPAALLVVAKIYEEQMQNADKAIETNRQILSIDENNTIALEAMERLYLKTGRYTELLSIYQKKLDLEMDPARQKGIRYQIAQLYENEIKKDPGQAVTAYRAILDGVGGENELAPSGRRWIVSTPPRRSGPSCRRPSLASSSLSIPRTLRPSLSSRSIAWGRFANSISRTYPERSRCYREILELAPAHSGAREALERRLGIRTSKSRLRISRSRSTNSSVSG